MKNAKLFSVIFSSLLSVLVLSACSKNKAPDAPKNPSQHPQVSISKNDYNNLISNAKNETKFEIAGKYFEGENKDFVSVVKKNFAQVGRDIIKAGGKIVFADKNTGYIHFKSTSSKALELIKDNRFQIFLEDDTMKTKLFKYAKNSASSLPNEIIVNDLSSKKLMKAEDLVNQFKGQYGADLDCSSSVIAVFDTGLDISRTDIFQDRIVYLRSIRMNDVALLTDAKEELIDGLTYLTAEFQGVKTKVLKSSRLQDGQKFYMGLIVERMVKPRGDGYDNYDLNQDGKDDGIFTIVVYKNQENRFAAYINVNDMLTYGDLGDQSIEDENQLMDFNWVAENIKDRFVSDADPAKSYYKYTTRMDILDGEEGLITDRKKGLMNVAITLEPGIELNQDGTDLQVLEKSPNGQNVYRVGLTGYDTNGHGTHVTGIAAGNFETASEYSSVCTKAKIINVANIGDSQHSNFYDQLIKLSQKYKNIVFNFSFGSNTYINDIQNPESKLMDVIARTYNIPFVKAAGNEGPGIKTHGITTSKYTIAVANYMNSNSREFFGYGNFEENKMWPDSSSSRGPMHDGALKPDIGAPGWVLSSTPLSASTNGANNSSFQYWPGTSMASPNVASVVALLFDAIEKSGQSEFSENSAGNSQATTLDKIRKSLLNSALPYDQFNYTYCSSTLGTSFNEWCAPQEFKFDFNWLEGGAGRINALGAWNILSGILKQDPIYFTTSTESQMPGYNQKAIGYFSIGSFNSQVPFYIKMEGENNPSDLTKHERMTLKISPDVDWLSFSKSALVRERVVDVFGGEDGAIVNLFISKEKLVKNGRLVPGLHHTVIKGYQSSDPENFSVTFPVTIIGYHTQYDGLNENFQFGANGFIPAAMFQRIFIPVTNTNGSTLLNLGTSTSMPGDLSMKVFYQGIEIDYKLMGATSPWVLSTSLHGEGRNNLKFVMSEFPQGLYEVIFSADDNSSYFLNGVAGSYYQFNTGRMNLNIDTVSLVKMNNAQYLMIQNAFNPGSALRISEASLKISELKHESTVVVKDRDQITIPINVPAGVTGVIIETNYFGFDYKTDIDITLLDSLGEMIEQSANSDSNERIKVALRPGQYQLNILGYSVPAGSEEFNFKISYILSNPIMLANQFIGENDEQVLKAGFRWYPNKMYSFKAKYEPSKITGLSAIPETSLVFNFSVKAFYNNDGKSTFVFNRDLE